MYKTVLRMNDELSERVKRFADKDGRSVNNFICTILDEYTFEEPMTEDELVIFNEYEQTAPNMMNMIRDAEDKEQAIKQTVEFILKGLLKKNDIIK